MVSRVSHLQFCSHIHWSKQKNTGNQRAANSLPYVDWNDCNIVMLKFMCWDFCHVLYWRRQFCTFPVAVTPRQKNTKAMILRYIQSVSLDRLLFWLYCSFCILLQQACDEKPLWSSLSHMGKLADLSISNDRGTFYIHLCSPDNFHLTSWAVTHSYWWFQYRFFVMISHLCECWQ